MSGSGRLRPELNPLGRPARAAQADGDEGFAAPGTIERHADMVHVDPAHIERNGSAAAGRGRREGMPFCADRDVVKGLLRPGAVRAADAPGDGALDPALHNG